MSHSNLVFRWLRPRRAFVKLGPCAKDDFCTLNLSRAQRNFFFFFLSRHARRTIRKNRSLPVYNYRFCRISVEQSSRIWMSNQKSEICYVNMSPLEVWPLVVWHVVQQTPCRILQALYFSEAGFITELYTIRIKKRLKFAFHSHLFKFTITLVF